MRTKPTLATAELTTLLTRLQQLPSKPAWLSVSVFAIAAKKQIAIWNDATAGRAERVRLTQDLRLFIRKARGAWLMRRGTTEMPLCLRLAASRQSHQPEATIFRDFFAWAGGAVEFRTLLTEAGLVNAKKQYARYQLLASREAVAMPKLSAALKELRRMLAVARMLMK